MKDRILQLLNRIFGGNHAPFVAVDVAAEIVGDGQRRMAVVNIGVRPTVHGGGVTVEPWLLDFDGDLYGHFLRLELTDFLRPERRFASLDALKEEIRRNAAQTRALLQEQQTEKTNRHT